MGALLRAVWATLRYHPIESDGMRFGRSHMWAIARPYWTHTIATTKAPCGCRKRFGLWHTIYCVNHAFGPRQQWYVPVNHACDGGCPTCPDPS